MYASLTLPNCQHQEKYKENQTQALHVWVAASFQTLSTRWCCIYMAFQPRGRSQSSSVQITITKYLWMMGVWELKVKVTSPELQLLKSFGFLLVQPKRPVSFRSSIIQCTSVFGDTLSELLDNTINATIKRGKAISKLHLHMAINGV